MAIGIKGGGREVYGGGSGELLLLFDRELLDLVPLCVAGSANGDGAAGADEGTHNTDVEALFLGTRLRTSPSASVS